MLTGLYTALSGMNAQRRVLDVTAHNIANQATEGYHRQKVELTPVGSAAAAALFAGTDPKIGGVDIEGVSRIVNQLAEDRFLTETSAKGETQTLRANLDQIERSFPEPSDDGLAALLDEFWGGWSDLSARPGDSGTRTQLLERAQTLVDGIRRTAADLDEVGQSSQDAIVRLAIDINDIAGQVAQLNKAILGSATPPNDLMDQRDLLMRDLATLTGADARPLENGTIDVYIGGRAIVSGTYLHPVNGDGGTLLWEADNSAVLAPGGQAAALKTTIEDVVPRYRALLDDVASQLVTQVNSLHAAGYTPAGATGIAFFDPGGTTAASLSLSASVAGQPQNVAAGAPAPGAPGPLDGEQARALAELAKSTSGPDAAYRDLVSGLGVEVRTAQRRDTIQDQVTAAAEADAQSVGGVSIDEEMANLVAAQRAFEANARVLTTVDSLLETIIGMVR